MRGQGKNAAWGFRQISHRIGQAGAAWFGIRGQLARSTDMSYHNAATLWLIRKLKWAPSLRDVTLLPHLVTTHPKCGATVPAWGAGKAVKKRICRWITGW